MKKYLIPLILLSFFILTICNVNAKGLNFSLIGKTIIIDPGHGGADSGAIKTNIYEKNINLELSLKIKTTLEKEGAIVLLTRDGDYDLSKPNALYRKKSDFDNRIRIINNSNANLYLSIHLNIYKNSVYNGPQIFYSNKIKENKNMAKFFQMTINKYTKTSRKSKVIKNVYMYDKLTISGLLIECGFLSNYQDLLNLTSEKYQWQFADYLTQIIILYYQQ